jgi:hypothetical protein
MVVYIEVGTAERGLGALLLGSGITGDTDHEFQQCRS